MLVKPSHLSALCLLLVLAAGSAAAVDRSAYSVEILVDGAPLEEHLARGATYVEALEGRDYSIRLRNRTGHRIAVALSVDGLNTIDARTTTAGEASKWILGPHQTITLDGWQVGPSTARRFFFTTEQRSYGAWLGRTANLGLISAVIFREKRHQPPYPIHRPADSREQDRLGRDSRRAGAEQRAPAAEGEPAQDAPTRKRDEAGPDAPALSDDLAATGIGDKLGHRVRRVRFEAETSPRAVIEIRYEYRDALVRLGVLPRHHARHDDPLDRRERARGFSDTGFAPDPFEPRR